jgi:hypothetical protein
MPLTKRRKRTRRMKFAMREVAKIVQKIAGNKNKNNSFIRA